MNMANRIKLAKLEANILETLNTEGLGSLDNPILANVTFTAVQLSNELSIATCYWICPDDVDYDETKKALIKAGGLLRSVVASNLSTYKVPTLKFVYDNSVAAAAEVEAIIEGWNKNE